MPLKRQAKRPNKRQSLQALDGRATVAIEDTVPRYSGTAYHGGIMYPRQAAQTGCVIDLQGLTIPNPQVLNARDHKAEVIVGTSTAVRNTYRSIECSGILEGDDDTIVRVARAAKQAGKPAYWPLSVDLSFSTADVEFLREGQTATVNGRQFTGPLPIVRRSELRRIDFVSKGGDSRALARITASAGGDSMTFEQWLADLGIADKSTLAPEQLAKYQDLYNQLNATDQAADSAMGEDDSTESGLTASGDDDDPGLDLQQIQRQAEQLTGQVLRNMRSKITAEQGRVEKIRQLCERFENPQFKVNGQQVSLEAHAIEQGWDEIRTELECRRESRAAAPSGQVRGKIEASAAREALVAAQLMQIGMTCEQALPRRMQIEAAADPGGGLPSFLFDDINSERKQRVLEAAQGYVGMHSMEFAAECMTLDGIHVGRGQRGIMRALEAAGGSTGSLSNVINTSAKSAISVSFQLAPDTTQDWVDTDTGNDFLTNQVVGLKTPGGSLDRLQGSTASEDHLSDKGEPIRIEGFGKQINITFETMTNDQLGAVMKALGSNGGWGWKARNTIPDLIYSLLLDNAAMTGDSVAFFHASHRNLITTSALSNTTLGSAIEKLHLAYELGDDGQKALLNLAPTHILVPPALRETAVGNIDTELIGAIAASQVPLLNTIRQYGIKPIVEPRLQLGLNHKLSGAALSGSSTTWFLISTDAKPVLLRYLTATGRSPQIRTTQLSQGRWGVNIDCRFDIGASLQRFQSMVKATA